MSATQPLTLSDEAVTRFQQALGADAVLLEEAQRDDYRDPYWFKDDRTYDSSVVLLPASTEEVQAVVRIANELGVALWTSSAGRNYGYGEYRAHLDFMDLAADQYSWGEHAYRRFCERIKDAVDPNGVLSPGRHGIWPAGMRER